MTSLAYIKDKIRDRKVRVVFADGMDERLPRAIRQIVDEALLQPIVIIDQASNPNIAEHYPRETELIDCSDISQARTWAEKLAKQGLANDLEKSIRQFKTPLEAAYMVLAAGGADGLVAGLVDNSKQVISSALKNIKLSISTKRASSFFLMDFDKHGIRAFADCGMIINPSAEELAEITLATVQTTQHLLSWEPKVALLSYSTLGSAHDTSTEKIRAAKKIIETEAPNLKIVGEVQFDAATNPTIARQKLPVNSPVMGDANILIFPDLNSGNIGYKIAEQIGGTQAYGPILQGFSKSISDLSRGSTIDDIIGAASIVAANALENSQ